MTFRRLGDFSSWQMKLPSWIARRLPFRTGVLWVPDLRCDNLSGGMSRSGSKFRLQHQGRSQTCMLDTLRLTFRIKTLDSGPLPGLRKVGERVARFVGPEALEFTYQRIGQENVARPATLGDFGADSQPSPWGRNIYIDTPYV